MPDQPAAARRGSVGRAAAVVDDLELQRAPAVADGHRGARGPRRGGGCWSAPPARRGRRRGPGPAGARPDRPRPAAPPPGPRPARALGQLLHAGERRAGRRSAMSASSARQHAEQPAHLGQRLAPGALDQRRATPRRAPGRARRRARAALAWTTITLTGGRPRRAARGRCACARRPPRGAPPSSLLGRQPLGLLARAPRFSAERCRMARPTSQGAPMRNATGKITSAETPLPHATFTRGTASDAGEEAEQRRALLAVGRARVAARHQRQQGRAQVRDRRQRPR